MPNPTSLRTTLLLFASPLLLLVVAIVAFVLERVSNSSISSHTARDMRDGSLVVILPSRNSTASTNVTLSMNINERPTIAIFGICALACVVVGIDGFGIWELRRVEGTTRHQRFWTWVVIVANIVMLGMSIGIFGFTTALQSSDGSWRSADEIGQGDKDYSRETWTCQIHKFYPSQAWAGTACGMLEAARYLLIAMALVSVLVIAGLWILINIRGGAKWLFGGKGRYAGFPNIYEMPPVVYGPSYQFQPVPQWVPHQGQQWAQQPVQQSYQQPMPPAPKGAGSPGQREFYS